VKILIIALVVILYIVGLSIACGLAAVADTLHEEGSDD